MSSREIVPVSKQTTAADVEIQRLAEELYRERIAEAQTMSAEEKLLAGEELFDYACAITLAGIRDESPGLSDEECLRLLEQRLALRERMEKEG